MGRPRGIDGLEGREPIGAVLRIGIKGPRGFPVDRDRFYLAEPYQNEAGIRPLHPRYSGFNNAAPEHRRVVLAQLVHHTQDEAFEFYLRAQMAPAGQPKPPGRQPWCEGNGQVARRYFGLTGKGPEPEDDWREIPCTNDRCPYRQRVRGKVACQPFARLIFRTVWKEGTLPSMVTKLSTRSWNTTANILGMFQAIERAAEAVGIESYSLMGFPFALMLTEKTGQLGQQKTKFPVVIATPQVDPITFLLGQADRARQLLDARPALAITDATQQDPAVEAADIDDITPGLHSRPTEEAP